MKSKLITGLDIPSWYKVLFVIIGILLVILNHSLDLINPMLDYMYRDIISVIIIGLLVLFSIGSWTAESIVVGISIFILLSVVYDLSVGDITKLRKELMFGSSIVLVIALSFGKLSIINLLRFIGNSLGIGGRRR